jgi:diguanylate cyclase (GGDEF)-like protein/PAS domain S-box-containing protein
MAKNERANFLFWIPSAFAGGAFALELIKLVSLLGLQHNPTGIDPQTIRWSFDVAEAAGATLAWRVFVSAQAVASANAARLLGWVMSVIVFAVVLATGTSFDLMFGQLLLDAGGFEKAVTHALALGVACAVFAYPMVWLIRAGDLRGESKHANVDRLLFIGMAGALSYFIALIALVAVGHYANRARLEPLREIVDTARHEQMLGQRLFVLLSRSRETDAPDELRAAIAQFEADRVVLERLFGEAEHFVPRVQSARHELTIVIESGRTIAAWATAALKEPGRPALRSLGGEESGDFRQDVLRLAAAVDDLTGIVGVAARRADAEAVGEVGFASAAVLSFGLALTLGIALPIARVLRRLTLVARYTHHPVLICDVRRRIVWTNDAFSRVSGYSRDDCIGHTPGELRQCKDTDPATIARLRQALNAGRGIRTEILNASRDGQRQWIDLDIRPVRDAGGQLTGFIGIEIDITSRMHLTRYLKAVLDTVGAAIVVQDASGAIIDCNVESERLFLRDRAQMIGQSLGTGGWKFVREDGNALRASDLPPARCEQTGQPVRNELLGIEREDGSRRWLQVNAQFMLAREGGNASVVSSFTDITERREMESQLHEEARTDKLTGLANRAMFSEWLDAALADRTEEGDSKFAILLLDFDRFKLINDSMGHHAGDDLLRQIADRLRRALRDESAGAQARPQDQIARFGGDEFVALVRSVQSIADAERVADRLLVAMRAPYEVRGTRLHCSASVGVYVSDAMITTADEALRGADTAMYEAKRAGGGTKVVFERQMQVRVARTLAIENALREALRSDELHLVYQPIVDLEDGGLEAVEALLRWNSSALGVVSPGEFVPIAEESGLIVPLGEWVLRQACHQMAEWRRERPADAPSIVSVNVSRVQMNEPDRLLALIREALAASGLPACALQVELTEREIMKDLDAVRSLVDELRGIGVKLAMDDFGTGASSLGCLCDLKFDVIKIDQSFVADLEHKTELLAVAHATVMMLRNLGLKSVAEGVETQAQLAILQAIGCDHGQGYLFGRPVRGGELLTSFPRIESREVVGATAVPGGGQKVSCANCEIQTCQLVRRAFQESAPDALREDEAGTRPAA